MRKIIFRSLLPLYVALVSVLSVVSCTPEGKGSASFDENFLYGKWQSVPGQLFYKYNSDHTGTTWDEADNVMESEAKKFTWTLVNDEFTHIYVTEISTTIGKNGAPVTKAAIPKVYTVTTLTASKLVYEDDFGKVFTFNKVK